MPKKIILLVLLLLLTLAACAPFAKESSNEAVTDEALNEHLAEQSGYVLKSDVDNINKHLDYTETDLKTIYFAGGCFWGVEAYMQKLYGVYQVTSGYANGDGVNPSYIDVISGEDGFAETVKVQYDPDRVSLKSLIDQLFLVIDPTTLNKQGNDEGVQYRTGIYYEDDEDAAIVKEAVQNEQSKYDEEVVTEAKPLKNFYRAEEEHQNYLEKNPNGYCHIDLSLLNHFKVDPIPKDEDIVKSLSKKQAE
ncbi:Peptide-methionine (S)-S-oxide reductase [Lentibacillus sp. JNUCC-1]|uniref:peptide-methionine (S)-S-oxide reductase MsrA n=1 Tax=Lentibacillus sp. JNUCC-1 TaxID=2654513 RepID=UPI0012E7285C|nr:peptide-methionine (S)-S-oxide reductase MsrA [Lentibacillus sp. JNUCC-1]MUV36810.1 Peptide-methionine (S)-S-oxide reductase [Lentibacillus sp. JNUCC-1]